MPSTQAIASLLIGDFCAPEFQEVQTAMSAVGASLVVRDLTEAIEQIVEQGFAPDLIVLAQSWPGQFRHSDWAELRQLVPLARVLGLLGSWCEGETRTGQPWPGMIRTYWHRWLPRWSEDLRRLTLSQLPAWGLPETMSDDERTMATRLAVGQSGGLVAVHCRRFELADMLGAACREHGYASAWLDPRRPIYVNDADVILWDGHLADLDTIRSLRSQSPDTDLIAMIDFLRPHEVAPLMQAGASRVVAKPLVLNDLFQIIEERLGSRHLGLSPAA